MSRNPVEQMSVSAKRALIALMTQRLGRLQALLDDLRRADEGKAAAVAQSHPQDASPPPTQ